jgi:hypothetical protein
MDGSDRDSERAANSLALIETAKANRIRCKSTCVTFCPRCKVSFGPSSNPALELDHGPKQQ